MSKKNKLMIGLSSTAIPLLAAVSAKCFSSTGKKCLSFLWASL
ncbi:hypothetical protein [Mycoplasmopsis bovis]